MTKTKQRWLLLWDYLLITICIITSGAIFWVGRLSSAVTFLFMLFLAIIQAFIIRPKHTKNHSYIFIIWVLVFCLLNAAIVSSGYKTNTMLGYIVALIAVYLIYSRYDFYRFRDILTNVVFVITAIGLPVYFLYYAGVLPTSTLHVKNASFIMCGPYTLGWWPNPFMRYSGIWHEPGAGQIIVNTAIWLNLDKVIAWNLTKWDKVKLIVLILGVVFSLSTGAYMVLMAFVAAVVMNIKIKSRFKGFIYLFLIVAALVVLYILFNSDVIQNKLFDADGESGSKAARAGDIEAFWQMTLDKPIWGYGLGTDLFWSVSTRLGNTANSSGILTYSASLGLIWLFLFVWYAWRGIRRMMPFSCAIFLLCAFILMQFNECFVEYPITNLFIFQFNSYIKNAQLA